MNRTRLLFFLVLTCFFQSCKPPESIEMDSLIAPGWTYGALRSVVRTDGQLFPISGGKILLVGGTVESYPDNLSAPIEIYDSATNTWEKRGEMPFDSKDLEFVQTVSGIHCWDYRSRTIRSYDLLTNAWIQSPASRLTHTSASKLMVTNYFGNGFLVFGDFQSVESYNGSTRTWTAQAFSSVGAETAISFGFITQDILFLYNNSSSGRIWRSGTNTLALVDLNLNAARAKTRITYISPSKWLVFGESFQPGSGERLDVNPEVLDLSTLRAAQISRPDYPKNRWSVVVNLPQSNVDDPLENIVFLGNKNYVSGDSDLENFLKALPVERFDAVLNKWTNLGSMADVTAAAIVLPNQKLLVLRNQSSVTELISLDVLRK